VTAYYFLCSLGFVLSVASLIVQCANPANYGKFASAAGGDKNVAETATTPTVTSTGDNESERENVVEVHPAAVEREPRVVALTHERLPLEETSGSCCCCPTAPVAIPQRLSHVLSDFPSGVVGMLLMYFLLPVPDYSVRAYCCAHRSAPSVVMLSLWVVHYVHRGLLHPFLMRYRDKNVDVGICIGGLIPNWTFAMAIALHLVYGGYQSPEYFYDARFIIGLALFAAGFALNRWADLRLSSLRASSASPWANTSGGASSAERSSSSSCPAYRVPRGGCFELVCNPNYLGELVQWSGYAVLTSSLAGVLWALFGLSTFLPRSMATRRWYSQKFSESELPENWKALIPFVI
jgi:hypothetical protein